MRMSELHALIENGEDSRVEFSRDDIAKHELAKELVSFLNHDGGTILLGVTNHGGILGARRPDLEDRVAELCRTGIAPPIVPSLSWARQARPRSDILAVRVPPGTDKPYARIHNGRRNYFVRAGSRCREASRSELLRLFQASGHVAYDRKPVPGSSFADFDLRRLVNYFRDVRGQPRPSESDSESWTRLLVNTELMVEADGLALMTVGGALLLGSHPHRLVRQAGISATAYTGTEKGYAAKARQTLRGPLVSLLPEPSATFTGYYPPMPATFSESWGTAEPGIVEQAVDFIRRNVEVTAWIERGRRMECWDYPLDTVREAVVNAVTHRDYTITVTDIELSLYADRLEIVSPGRLPNTITVDKMRAGCRATRNQLIHDTLRDYRYIEGTGLGVPRKIVRGMLAHNGTEPDLLAAEDQFTVRLWK